jgi:potassium-dependent mechanosensitive channel
MLSPLSTLTVFLTLLIFFSPLSLAAPDRADTAAVQSQLPLTNYAASAENLELKINELNSRTDLDANLKNKLTAFYRAANESIRSEELFEFWAKTYQEAIEKSAEHLKAQQEKLAQLQQAEQQKTVENFTNFSLAQLEQRLTLEKTSLAELDTKQSKIEQDLNVQNARAAEIRQESEATKQALDDSEQKNEVFKLLSESELEREARQLQFKTLQSKLTSRLKMLNLELVSQPARVELLNLQLQEVQLQKQSLSTLIALLEKQLAQQQQSETRQLRQKLLQIEQQSLDKHPLIQSLTKQNIGYTLELQTLSTKLERSNQLKQQLEAQTTEVAADFNSAEKKITLAGLSPALGKILREQRYKLNSLIPSQQPTKYLQHETALTGLAELKIESRLKELVDIDTELQNLLAPLRHLSAAQQAELSAELRQLLTEQKELLNKLSKADAAYLRGLADYDFAKQQLIKQVDKYALYLDERLLWVPSSAPLSSRFFNNFYVACRWFSSPAHWRSVSGILAGEVLTESIVSLLALTFFSLLVFYRRRLHKNIRTWENKIGGIYSDQFYFTAATLLYELLCILPLPLLFLFASHLLKNAEKVNEFSLAVADGLFNSALPLFFLQLLQRLFSPSGLVEKHFNWTAEMTHLLYQQIGWIRRIVVPALFVMAMANAANNPLHGESLGRLALIITLIAMIFGLAKILHPERGVFQFIIQEQTQHWLIRLRYVWYALAIFAPLTIIIFALSGYYLSALELQQKLVGSLRLIFVIIIVRAVILRWLNLVNRQLALKNAQQKYKTDQLNSPSSDSADNETAEPLLLDIPKINQQTTTLLNLAMMLGLLIGHWLIWKNILPAFAFLDRVVLWQHIELIDKEEVLLSITLINLFSAGLYLIVTLIAVANLPGLMEVLILRRFAIETGSRYAINQLTRYLLGAVGVIFISNELGASWSQVQWLVAALSVGLGFGLQEIFANLVSGIILLFERPIRVGDTVTIGDVTGKVCQIKMRATSIIDWDQKDLIVPNKTFITDKLINWSLSTPITRVVIGLSLAYGTDLELAHRVIADTVNNTPLVLAEPKADIYILSFGDSGIEFSIRVYVNELAHRLTVTHDLHLRLYQALAEQQIEIPFPQRDIHIRHLS